MVPATDRESVTQHCVELIAKAKQLPAEQVRLDSSLESLEMDSLDKVSLSFDIEEAYGITIPDSALATLHTVGDIANGVADAVQAKQTATDEAAEKSTLAATEA